MEQLLAISPFAPLSGLAFRRLKTAFLKIEMFESLCYIFEKKIVCNLIYYVIYVSF